MRGSDILNRLKQVLSKYTDDFSDIVSITSLTRSGTTITAISSEPHGAITGDYLNIRGATNPITIISLTRVGSIVTVTTLTDHGMVDPSGYSPAEAKLLTVTISGVTPTDYNGSFQLLSTPDSKTFSFKINTTPASAALGGFLLKYDQSGYNGYKQVTVIDDNTFTYETSLALQSPSQGTIELINDARMENSATVQRANEHYSQDENRMLQKWLYVVMDAAPVSDGSSETTASDISTSMDTNKEYNYTEQQFFSIFVFFPSQNDLLAGNIADDARDLTMPLLKTLANLDFPTNLSQGSYQPVTYVGNETEDYNTVFYRHRFDFVSKLYIKECDTAEFDDGTPLLVIDGTTQDKDLIYKPRFR